MIKVLITGGTGLIGKQLGKKLIAKGYEVVFLSRNKSSNTKFPTLTWDIKAGEIDKQALNSFNYIIHLAGVNIGEQRWTAKRKLEIYNSRIKSGELILNNIDLQHTMLKAYVSASAIGYYGGLTNDNIFTELDPPYNDFLGQTCRDWEQVAHEFSNKGIRSVQIRTGLVLSKQGGALSKFNIPIKMGIGSALGSGKQYMPWIHIHDLCNIYIYALEHTNMQGAYNAVAPEHITNKEFTKKMAQNIKKPFWFPNIPAWLIKLIFGEMSAMLLNGSRVSSKKIEDQGYKFKYPTVFSALKQIYHEC